jgi:alpha-D-xyloside xylohydrolase
MPVMRAMPLVFPQTTLVRTCDTQFMCGDALLVAPIIRAGGGVDVALPPGAWYDLNTRQRFAGKQVLHYTAPLDQFPVFGREGHVLPLGRAVQHTGEIDAAQPLEMAWVFGAPDRAVHDYAQLRVEAGGAVRAAQGLRVEVFGDASTVNVRPL